MRGFFRVYVLLLTPFCGWSCVWDLLIAGRSWRLEPPWAQPTGFSSDPPRHKVETRPGAQPSGGLRRSPDTPSSTDTAILTLSPDFIINSLPVNLYCSQPVSQTPHSMFTTCNVHNQFHRQKIQLS